MFTPRQIAALKYLIFKDADATDRSKQVLAFLIDMSDGLTKEVCVSLVADREGFTADEIRDIEYGVDRTINSTSINWILTAMGVKIGFSVHYGDFDPDRDNDPLNCDGQFAGRNTLQVLEPGLTRANMPTRYTFWLSELNYSRNATNVATTRERLEQIDLDKTNLFSSLEPL